MAVSSVGHACPCLRYLPVFISKINITSEILFMIFLVVNKHGVLCLIVVPAGNMFLPTTVMILHYNSKRICTRIDEVNESCNARSHFIIF